MLSFLVGQPLSRTAVFQLCVVTCSLINPLAETRGGDTKEEV